LGAEYVYKESNNLEIHVNVSNDSGEIITETLALPSDKVHLGISNEYAQTILNTSMEVFMKLSVIPSGILTFILVVIVIMVQIRLYLKKLQVL